MKIKKCDFVLGNTENVIIDEAETEISTAEGSMNIFDVVPIKRSHHSTPTPMDGCKDSDRLFAEICRMGENKKLMRQQVPLILVNVLIVKGTS